MKCCKNQTSWSFKDYKILQGGGTGSLGTCLRLCITPSSSQDLTLHGQSPATPSKVAHNWERSQLTDISLRGMNCRHPSPWDLYKREKLSEHLTWKTNEPQ